MSVDMARPESGNEYQKLFSSGYLAHSTEKEELRIVLANYCAAKHFRRVLDVGPGDGAMTQVLAQHAEEIYAVEPQAEYCQQVQAQLPNACVLHGLVQEQNFPADHFDLIFCSHMLYYLPLEQWAPLLQKMQHWLTPAGRLIVVLNSADSDWYRYAMELAMALKVVPDFSFADPTHCFPVLAGGAEQILHYRSVLAFEQMDDQAHRWFTELFLLLPAALVTAEQCRTVAQFVAQRTDAAGTFTIQFAHVMGIWKK